MADWFEQPEAEVLAGLDSGRQGIDSGQAEQRLKEFGGGRTAPVVAGISCAV